MTDQVAETFGDVLHRHAKRRPKAAALRQIVLHEEPAYITELGPAHLNLPQRKVNSQQRW